MNKTKPEPQKRKGFSLVELLVVIIVIILVVGLIFPAIHSSKQGSKKLTCMNNIRNIGLAVVNYSSGANSQLPLLVDENIVDSSPNAALDNLTWCTAILPFMDEVGFRQRWDTVASAAANGDAAAITALTGTSGLNSTNFHVFVCSDDQFNMEPGALSYVVNVGYVMTGYNTSTDTAHDATTNLILTATNPATPAKFASGVFWREGTDVPRMSLDFISAADGITNTLMLSENLQAGDWASQDTGSLGFGIDMQGILPLSDVDGSESLVLPAAFNLKRPLTGRAVTDSRIGANISAAKSSAWRPSSSHRSGAINVVFCNGRGTSLTPEIDAGIYARLLTPAGLRYGQAVVDKTSY